MVILYLDVNRMVLVLQRSKMIQHLKLFVIAETLQHVVLLMMKIQR